MLIFVSTLALFFSSSSIISPYIIVNLSNDGFKFDPKRIYLEKIGEEYMYTHIRVCIHEVYAMRSQMY